MGAECPWTVKVLITAETYVEVSAVTQGEAKQKAERMPGVLRALDVQPCFFPGLMPTPQLTGD